MKTEFIQHAVRQIQDLQVFVRKIQLENSDDQILIKIFRQLSAQKYQLDSKIYELYYRGSWIKYSKLTQRLPNVNEQIMKQKESFEKSQERSNKRNSHKRSQYDDRSFNQSPDLRELPNNRSPGQIKRSYNNLYNTSKSPPLQETNFGFGQKIEDISPFNQKQAYSPEVQHSPPEIRSDDKVRGSHDDQIIKVQTKTLDERIKEQEMEMLEKERQVKASPPKQRRKNFLKRRVKYDPKAAITQAKLKKQEQELAKRELELKEKEENLMVLSQQLIKKKKQVEKKKKVPQQAPPKEEKISFINPRKSVPVIQEQKILKKQKYLKRKRKRIVNKQVIYQMDLSKAKSRVNCWNKKSSTKQQSQRWIKMDDHAQSPTENYFEISQVNANNDIETFDLESRKLSDSQTLNEIEQSSFALQNLLIAEEEKPYRKGQLFTDDFLQSIQYQLICEENFLNKDEEPCNFKKLQKAYEINFTKKFQGIQLLFLNFSFIKKDLRKQFLHSDSDTVRKEEFYYSRIPFIKKRARFFKGYKGKNFEKILEALMSQHSFLSKQ